MLVDNAFRYAVSMPRERAARLKAAFPNIAFSHLVLAMMDFAERAGFCLDPDWNATADLYPVLFCNQLQIDYLVHAVRYISRAWEQTSTEGEIEYLRSFVVRIASEEKISVPEYNELVALAHSNGWDGSAQDEAPQPKEGPARITRDKKGRIVTHTKDAPNRPVRAPQTESAASKVLKLVQPKPEEIEEFGL